MSMSSKVLRMAVAALALCATGVHAQAQGPQYPSRPIRFIVPFPPGGPTDTIARALADGLRVSLGQPVVVENKSGANGNIGMGEAMRAPADGHTLALITTTTSALNPHLYAALSYDAEKAVAPIAILAKATYVLLARKAQPAALKDLVAAIKAKPGSFNGGYSNTTSLIGNDFLKRALSLDFVNVPYQADGAVLLALAGGEVDFYFTVSPQVGSLVEAGKFNAVAVAAARRSPLLPNTPTFAEAGFPSFLDMTAWFGVATQAGVPQNIVDRLNRELTKIAATPEFAARVAQLGWSVAEPGSAAETAAFVRQERARWQAPIRAAGVKIE